MFLESCDLDYIYQPLTAYRAQIFEHLYKTVPDDVDVLDLGCGSVGFYWALAYLQKAKSISFFDQHPAVIDQLSARIEALTPEQIHDDFADVLEYLNQNFKPDAQVVSEQWLYDFHNKIAAIDVCDALSDQPQKNYDVVIGVELFDTANTIEELEKMIQYCADSLHSGGILTGCYLNYKLWDASMEQFAEQKMAGKLNPSAEMLADAAKKCGFEVLSLHTEQTGMSKFPFANFYEFTI